MLDKHSKKRGKKSKEPFSLPLRRKIIKKIEKNETLRQRKFDWKHPIMNVQLNYIKETGWDVLNQIVSFTVKLHILLLPTFHPMTNKLALFSN